MTYSAISQKGLFNFEHVCSLHSSSVYWLNISFWIKNINPESFQFCPVFHDTFPVANTWIISGSAFQKFFLLFFSTTMNRMRWTLTIVQKLKLTQSFLFLLWRNLQQTTMLHKISTKITGPIIATTITHNWVLRVSSLLVVTFIAAGLVNT